MEYLYFALELNRINVKMENNGKIKYRDLKLKRVKNQISIQPINIKPITFITIKECILFSILLVK